MYASIRDKFWKRRDRIAEELEEADEASEQRLRILTEYVQSNKRERTEEDDAIPIVVTCATTVNSHLPAKSVFNFVSHSLVEFCLIG